MDSLKKYMVQGQIQEELMKEMGDQPKTISESSISKQTSSTEYKRNVSRDLVESVLREFEMASQAVQGYQDPYEGCDPRVKKAQGLVRIIQDALWKIQDSNRKPYYSEEEMDDDIKELMVSNQEPIIRACINKLYNMWITGEKPQQTPTEPTSQETVSITVGQEVTTPKDESFVVENIDNNFVYVKNTAGEKRRVTKEIITKWLNS